jgi:hypothetical protein
VSDFGEAGPERRTETLRASVGLDAGLVFVEAYGGIQSRHADVDARPPRNVLGIGLREPFSVKRRFRRLDRADVAVVAASREVI